MAPQCYRINEIQYCMTLLGAMEGDPNFDSFCDINKDREINVLDFIEMQMNMCPDPLLTLASIGVGALFICIGIYL